MKQLTKFALFVSLLAVIAVADEIDDKYQYSIGYEKAPFSVININDTTIYDNQYGMFENETTFEINSAGDCADFNSIKYLSNKKAFCQKKSPVSGSASWIPITLNGTKWQTDGEFKGIEERAVGTSSSSFFSDDILYQFTVDTF